MPVCFSGDIHSFLVFVFNSLGLEVSDKIKPIFKAFLSLLLLHLLPLLLLPMLQQPVFLQIGIFRLKELLIRNRINNIHIRFDQLLIIDVLIDFVYIFVYQRIFSNRCRIEEVIVTDQTIPVLVQHQETHIVYFLHF